MAQLERRKEDLQQLRAYIDTKKREVRAAEQRYDIQDAASKLQQLSLPLRQPDEFPTGWKEIYVDVFYRDIAGFILGFVAINLEVCFSEQQRSMSIDAFFDVNHVPASKVIDVLATTLANTTLNKVETSGGASRGSEAEADAQVTILQCTRQLENAIQTGALDGIFREMLELEYRLRAYLAFTLGKAGNGRSLVAFQSLVSHLGSLPGNSYHVSVDRAARRYLSFAVSLLCVVDLIYNRRQRDTPSSFKPRHYFPVLGETFFRELIGHYSKVQTTRPLPQVSFVFRMLTDKLIRIGQTSALIQSWLRTDNGGLYDKRAEDVHRLLLRSLPEFCHEQFLLQLSKADATVDRSLESAKRSPKYRLLALLPVELAMNQQFQYVVGHKLLLKRPFDDLFFLRVLVDVLARASTGGTARNKRDTPLSTIFDVVLTRWSQTEFAGASDYALNVSICFFLRYAMTQLATTTTAAFVERDWVAKLCKGVQDHMSHSLERTRILGMRVGESLSLIISADNPLNFEIEGEDPLEVYGSAVDAGGVFELDDMVATLSVSGNGANEAIASNPLGATKRAKESKKTMKAFVLDPDELIDSDSEEGISKGEGEEGDEDSDSDMSLEAYDMDDDEEDLTAKRPVYLKDLIAGLNADDDRERTEAALAEAETLLRKKPRDLHENATAVVTALLRLEDKFNTPHFAQLRANALAAACAVSPLKTIPYFHSQALEREQLLQSRIDVLQAMTAAAQELSEIGAFRPKRSKTLLTEDLDARTTRELKTRRWGYRRDPVVQAKKNAFAECALRFFSPLLFGYIDYVRTHSQSKSLSDIENVFLAHLLHALASFVECVGHAPQAISMAKCLLEFAWHQRHSSVAAVRRQVIFSVSRVLLVVPPFLLRQEMGDSVVEMVTWLRKVHRQDPDEGCREGSRLLLSSGAIPMLSLA